MYLKRLGSETDQIMETGWLNNLSEIKRRHLESGISIKTKLIEEGTSSRTIAEKIVKFSTEEQVDLLVIGSIGLGGIQKLKPLVVFPKI